MSSPRFLNGTIKQEREFSLARVASSPSRQTRDKGSSLSFVSVPTRYRQRPAVASRISLPAGWVAGSLREKVDALVKNEALSSKDTALIAADGETVNDLLKNAREVAIEYPMIPVFAHVPVVDPQTMSSRLTKIFGIKDSPALASKIIEVLGARPRAQTDLKEFLNDVPELAGYREAQQQEFFSLVKDEADAPFVLFGVSPESGDMVPVRRVEATEFIHGGGGFVVANPARVRPSSRQARELIRGMKFIDPKFEKAIFPSRDAITLSSPARLEEVSTDPRRFGCGYDFI